MYTVVYMLAADAAVAAAVFGLEHMISYCNHVMLQIRMYLVSAGYPDTYMIPGT